LNKDQSTRKIFCFAIQHDVFCSHLESLYGDSSHMYLVVSSTEHSYEVCLNKMGSAAELWKSIVN
jgi:hypothetical protein